MYTCFYYYYSGISLKRPLFTTPRHGETGATIFNRTPLPVAIGKKAGKIHGKKATPSIQRKVLVFFFFITNGPIKSPSRAQYNTRSTWFRAGWKQTDNEIGMYGKTIIIIRAGRLSTHLRSYKSTRNVRFHHVYFCSIRRFEQHICTAETFKYILRDSAFSTPIRIYFEHAIETMLSNTLLFFFFFFTHITPITIRLLRALNSSDYIETYKCIYFFRTRELTNSDYYYYIDTTRRRWPKFHRTLDATVCPPPRRQSIAVMARRRRSLARSTSLKSQLVFSVSVTLLFLSLAPPTPHRIVTRDFLSRIIAILSQRLFNRETMCNIHLWVTYR